MISLGLLLLVAAEPISGAALLGRARLAQGRPRQAVQVLEQALAERPDDVNLRLVLGRAQASSWMCEKSLETLKIARDGGEWGPEAAASEGRCRQGRGDLYGALAAWGEAAALSPDSTPMRVSHAIVLARSGHVAEALDLVRAVEDPAWATLVRVHLALHQGIGDPDRELGLLAQAVTDVPELTAAAHLLDGRRWLDLDDPSAAEVPLREALRRAPTDPHVLAMLAECLRRMGNQSDAAAVLSRPFLRASGALVMVDAVSARLEVDRGQLGRALEILGRWEGVSDPHLDASRAYLDAARGGPPAPRQLTPLGERR